MIVYECIEFHLKDCARWIIVIELRVLLTTYYLIWVILIDAVLDVHVRSVKIKTLFDLDVVMMHLLEKKFIEKYLCWFTHEKPYVSYEIMVERMVGSTFSSSNVHWVVNDNSNSYRNMNMDVMWMNQSHASECSIVDEESY
jgi:hypothetical protein